MSREERLHVDMLPSALCRLHYGMTYSCCKQSSQRQSHHPSKCRMELQAGRLVNGQAVKL